MSNSLRPSDYDSFAMAILSQNHQEINIAESIWGSIKVIIDVVFLMMYGGDPHDNMAVSFDRCRKLLFFSSGRVSSHPNLI